MTDPLMISITVPVVLLLQFILIMSWLVWEKDKKRNFEGEWNLASKMGLPSIYTLLVLIAAFIWGPKLGDVGILMCVIAILLRMRGIQQYVTEHEKNNKLTS